MQMVPDAAHRRLRLLLLEAAVALADLLSDRIRRRKMPVPVYPESAGQGLSVIIPERGNPVLLAECLSGVYSALRDVDGPSEVIVVVDGGEAGDYREPAGRFHDVRWLFYRDSVGFSGAIRRGLEAARHDWVYLLNNDVILEDRALAEVLKWRGPSVFAVASQIHFRDADRRREETGWTDFKIVDGTIEMFHAVPEDQTTVRGGLCASGGCSLFRKQLLEQIIDPQDPYHPFYWEDAEWGAVAWKMGYDVLFCPASKVQHCHRATISKYYPSEEIDRVFRRNTIRFQLRNFRHLGSFERVCARIMELDTASFWELLGKKHVWNLFKARLRSTRQPFDDSSLKYTCARYYLKPQASRSKPSVLFVSPFAICPPSHGGAMRMRHLLQCLSADFDVTVLSDEREAYSEASRKYFDGLAGVHLVGGRLELPDHLNTRSGRMESHCHDALRDELRRRIFCDAPGLVQIEFVELAPLIEAGPKTAPWAITLHDVTLSGNTGVPGEEDRRERELIGKYDATIACSTEDANLFEDRSKIFIVPNGMNLDGFEYAASQGNTAVLFMGPFRYKPNLEGIQIFLEKVYPRLRETVPAVELWLLGGHRAAEKAAPFACFRQPGVTIYDYIADPRPFLQRCALTINPLIAIRGSSLKLIESVAAGRVCVSTRDGARGFTEAGFPSLFVTETIENFYDPLERLLGDPAYRASVEKPDRARLERYSWAESARKQSAADRGLLGI